MLAELRGHFRPEFLNRVDEIVLFKPLTLAEIERIVDLMLDELRARLAERRITLEVSRGARGSSPSRGSTRRTAPARCGGSSPARWRPGSAGRSCAVTC